MRLNAYRKLVLEVLDLHAEGCNHGDSLRAEVAALGRQRAPRKAKGLKDHADEFFSLNVRARGRCEECGSTKNLQCAHGFSRFYKGTRWDERNAFCLCAGCHKYFTHRPLEWRAWMLTRLGQDGYDAIERQARHGIRKLDLQMVVVGLNARARELGVLSRKPAKEE